MMIAANALEMEGVIWIAIAGIDIAPWAIKERSLGLPIYQLLGGKIRDQVSVYASSMSRDLASIEEARRAAYFVDQTISTVSEVRNAVGDNIDILVAVNGAYSVHHAIEIGLKLGQLSVYSILKSLGRIMT